MDTPLKNKTPQAVTKIRKDDLDWLRNRATRNHRTPPEEISAIRELVELAGLDMLPHPEDGQHVPVIYKVTNKRG